MINLLAAQQRLATNQLTKVDEQIRKWLVSDLNEHAITIKHKPFVINGRTPENVGGFTNMLLEKLAVLGKYRLFFWLNHLVSHHMVSLFIHFVC